MPNIMPSKNTSIHGEWSSRLAFILAAAGSAVGLGNIWKFPYMAGENGGGAFVIVYLAFIVLFGLPIMMAEVLMGRRGRQSPVNSLLALCKQEQVSRLWSVIGWSGMLAGVLILSYYSVIAGWSLFYVLESASGGLHSIQEQAAENLFTGLLSDPWTLIFWHSVFMLMTMFVVVRGVSNGLEVAVKFLMPMLFILILILIAYAISQGGFMQGLQFMFTPDFSKLNGSVLLDAMGQAFFSLSLGMGAIMIYGSYLPQTASIGRTTLAVAIADSSVAVLAGLAIFPIVFINNLETAQGPGLIFNTLPLAFGQMPGGIIFGTLFFILLVFAAWTSSISLIEPAVAWLVETKKHSRIKASLVCGLITWLIGLATVLSFNYWDSITLLGMTVFDCLDYLTFNVMLPLGGLLIAIFVGWVMRAQAVSEEMNMGSSGIYQLWRLVLRYFTPIGLSIVFLSAIGVI